MSLGTLARKREMVKVGSSASPAWVRGSRLIKLTEVRQRGGKIDMRAWMISVDLDRTTEPRDRLLVGAELQLGEAREDHPNKSLRITRTEAECLLDMGLGVLLRARQTPSRAYQLPR